jgi:hypothetical protein
MRRNIHWSTLLLLGLAVVLTACGSSKGAVSSTDTSTTGAGVNPNVTEAPAAGDIPDNQVYVAFAPASGGYTLKYPQGWAQGKAGAATTFTEHFNGIEVAATKTPTAPTTASVVASDVAKLRSLTGFKLGKVDTVTRAAGPAIRITYEATSPTDPVTGKTVTLAVERYLFWHNGTLVTITLSSAKGSDNVDPWKTVTDSLVWK